MAELIEIWANGDPYQVEENMLLLDALRAQGIRIPALCWHVQTGYQGRCSLCAVEVFREGNWEVKHACALLCQQGLEIRTHSPRIRILRARAASMLLRHAPFADQALESMLGEMGEDPLAEQAPAINAQSPPGCILCGRCVAICRKIGRQKLTFLGRGQKLRISYVDGAVGPRGCGTCRACKKLCPAGFIKTTGESAFRSDLYR